MRVHIRTHHFNSHFPCKPGLASSPLILSIHLSLFWACSWDRPKLSVSFLTHSCLGFLRMSPWPSLHHLYVQHLPPNHQGHHNLPIIVNMCTGSNPNNFLGVGHLLLLARLPGTRWVMICAIWCLALTVSDVCLRLICSQSTSIYSALEVSHFMRYINLQLTCFASVSILLGKVRNGLCVFLSVFHIKPIHPPEHTQLTHFISVQLYFMLHVYW